MLINQVNEEAKIMAETIKNIGYDKLNNESFNTAIMMKQKGGSFVQALGEALLRADVINKIKIKLAFPEYWNEYYKMSLEEDKKALQVNKK